MSVNTNYQKMTEECLICFDEMKQNEKLLKCKLCKNTVHTKCFNEWCKINKRTNNNKNCLHCQRQTEFDYVNLTCIDYLKQYFFRIK